MTQHESAGTDQPLQDGPNDDWNHLRGQDIQIIEHGRVIDSGRVDAVMPNGSALWLMNDGATLRRIIENAPEISIRADHRLTSNRRSDVGAAEDNSADPHS